MDVPGEKQGIVSRYSLFLGTAERADVVGDFSACARQTLILCNDRTIMQILNHEVSFGWEYVWHCHILSHAHFTTGLATFTTTNPSLTGPVTYVDNPPVDQRYWYRVISEGLPVGDTQAYPGSIGEGAIPPRFFSRPALPGSFTGSG